MTRDYYLLFGPSKLSRLQLLSQVLPEVEQLGDPMDDECYQLEVDPEEKNFREDSGPITFRNLVDLTQQTEKWDGLSIPFDCSLNDKFVNVCPLPNDTHSWFSIQETGSRIYTYYWHDIEAGPRWLRFLVRCAQKIDAEYFVLQCNDNSMLTADEFVRRLYPHCPFNLFGLKINRWPHLSTNWNKPSWACEERIDDFMVVYPDDFGKLCVGDED